MKKIMVISIVAASIVGVLVWRSKVVSDTAEESINAIIAAPVVTTRVARPVIYLVDDYKNPLVPAKKITSADRPSPVAPSVPPPAAGTAKELPAVINWPVAFLSQAPFKIWDRFHEETCEEAAMFMVDRYFAKKEKFTAKEGDAALHAIVDWEKKNIGRYEDTTAEEMAKTLREYFGLKNVELVRNPTVEAMKRILSEGKLILLPADGRELDNPNFKNGGPPYHVILIRGYNAEGGWITNDPGTRLGEGFVYPEDNLMTAMHDYLSLDTPHGDKVVIAVAANS